LSVFGKETLASSSLTGQASNANLLKVSKPSLDPTKVKDIVGVVYLIFIFSYLYISGYLPDFIRNICTRMKCAFSLSTAKHLMHIINYSLSFFKHLHSFFPENYVALN